MIRLNVSEEELFDLIMALYLDAAVDAGVDGLISTKLPLEDASQTLLQICHGERCFRFDAEMERQPLGAARHASRKPFDASWMFTECAPER